MEMKNWLNQKIEEKNNLFQELIGISLELLNDIHQEENRNLYVRVIFSKDDWLKGSVELELLEKNENEDYDIVEQYSHNIYNTNKDIQKNSMFYKYMSKGLFTNTWFSVLDNSHNYDTTILFMNNTYLLENEDCEYRENRMKQTHIGFNIIDKPIKKNKIK